MVLFLYPIVIKAGETMTTHEQIIAQFETYVTESAKFEDKGVKASASRARKALAEIAKLSKERRKEIQEEKERRAAEA